MRQEDYDAALEAVEGMRDAGFAAVRAQSRLSFLKGAHFVYSWLADCDEFATGADVRAAVSEAAERHVAETADNVELALASFNATEGK